MKRIVAILLALVMVSLVCTALAETITVAPGDTVTLDISLTDAGGQSAMVGIWMTDGAPVTFAGAKGAVGDGLNDTVPPKAFNDYFVVINLEGVTISADGSSLSGNLDSYKVGNLLTGKIGTLTFTVDEDAAGGTYTVEAYVHSGSVTVDGSVTFTLESAPAGDRVPGDANDDGLVDTMDVLLILQYMAGSATINLSNADCSGDGQVDTMDALLILQYMAGMDVELK